MAVATHDVIIAGAGPIGLFLYVRIVPFQPTPLSPQPLLRFTHFAPVLVKNSTDFLQEPANSLFAT
jgi:hypothetical protein